MTKRKRALDDIIFDSLITRGFDESYETDTHEFKVKCSQCEALVIKRTG